MDRGSIMVVYQAVGPPLFHLYSKCFSAIIRLCSVMSKRKGNHDLLLVECVE